MKYNVLSYLIGEGFRNVFKNKKSTAASLFIMCATMVIFGVCFIIGENVNNIMNELEMQQGMQVFINKDASNTEIKNLKEQINSIEGVNSVEFVSEEDALNKVKEMLKDKKSLISGYEADNPFKASYIVKLTDLKQSEEVKQKIEGLTNVSNIEMRSETINKLMSITNIIRVVSFAILILLIVISIFIIANTIKLTVHARRREISIMKYVGATNNFIRSPFIVEGIVIGVISSAISLLILGVAYKFICDFTYNSMILGSEGMNSMNISLLNFSDIFTLIVIVYLALGIGIGTLGSVISMRKYLDV